MLEKRNEKDMISVRYGEPENKPTTVQTNAVSEDRTHDLRIMRPTRYQLRYHRHVPEPTKIFAHTKLELFESAAKRAAELGGCAMDNGTKRPWDDGQQTVDHGAIHNGTLGQ